MLTITIPYNGNQVGLSQLLVSLQPQLHPDDDIYIIDRTKDHSGLRIARKYGSTRCFIFVELAEVDYKTAVGYGFQNMKENNQEGCLIISEDCVISTTFIANLKKAIKSEVFKSLSFEIVNDDKISSDFKWFNTSYFNISYVGSFHERYDSCMYISGNSNATKLGILGNEMVVSLSDDKNSK